MKKKKLSLCILPIIAIVFFALPVNAQVTIGNQAAPHSFSLLELSTQKQKSGLRLPQLTTVKRDSIASTLDFTSHPNDAKGLVIYNTDTQCLQYWNGTKWVSFCIPLNSSGTKR